MTYPATAMRWACRAYGGPDVLRFEEAPLCSPGPGEVLIGLCVTTVESADARIRAQRMPSGFRLMGRAMFGFRRPRQPVLGGQAAGVIIAVGVGVTRWRVGDEVLVVRGIKMGCHAEYLLIDDDALMVEKPAGLSFADAVSLPFGGLVALDYLRRARVKSGERMLVLGASGSVGTAFVQLAKYWGAHVTASTSEGNIALLLGLGADAVIDYRRQPYTDEQQCWDIIVDTVAASSFADARPRLNEGGRYLAIAGGLLDLFARRRGTKRSLAGPATERIDDLRELLHLAEHGAVRAVIDSRYDFGDLPAAHARADSGRKRGSLVINV
ncbi:MAG: NAD(P)-dependent alcohol dehydrogenase [Sphingopyxis sp.]|uniref:NAD(P)-dependent alcohol dehydrogenase n=1 Tax=Sphingopyxis sp. TaxID=1908224 RepID=UPI002ABAF34F|nr:NAD(P)-dependent alcohol dehydrogenase [Sphingopyxis sp.]MDZ3832218.1 NAD(P)-dependent alcohol dehydrogenase [Sphingopyxis sp.]